MHMSKSHRRLGSHFRRLNILLGLTIIMGIAFVPSGSAVPKDPNAVVVAQDCTDGTGTIVTLLPGRARHCGTSLPRW